MPVFNTAANTWRMPSYLEEQQQIAQTDLAEAQTAGVEKDTEQADDQLRIDQANASSRTIKAVLDLRTDRREEVERGATRYTAWIETHPNDLVGATTAFKTGFVGFDEAVGKDLVDDVIPPEFAENVMSSDYKEALLSRRPDKPTGHQQVVGGLVEDDYITAERGNEILLAQEIKDGTITGTSEFDPSQQKPASQVAKDVTLFQEQVIGAVKAVQMGTAALKIAKATPDALGKPGALITFGSEVVITANAIMDWMQYKPIDAADTVMQSQGYDAFDWGKLDTNKLNIVGAEAAAFKAAIYGISFASAVSEQGIRPTDKDIQAYIDQIAGNSSSALAFRRVIVQFMARQDRGLRTIANVKGIGQGYQDLAFGEWDRAYEEFKAEAKDVGLPRGPWNKVQGFSDLSLEDRLLFIDLAQAKER